MKNGKLSRRDVTPKMWSVVCHLRNGNKLHRHRRSLWIDCGYEAGVAHKTFIALLRRGLIVPKGYTKRREYKLSRKGIRWSLMEYFNVETTAKNEARSNGGHQVLEALFRAVGKPARQRTV